MVLRDNSESRVPFFKGPLVQKGVAVEKAFCKAFCLAKLHVCKVHVGRIENFDELRHALQSRQDAALHRLGRVEQLPSHCCEWLEQVLVLGTFALQERSDRPWRFWVGEHTQPQIRYTGFYSQSRVFLLNCCPQKPEPFGWRLFLHVAGLGPPTEKVQHGTQQMGIDAFREHYVEPVASYKASGHTVQAEERMGRPRPPCCLFRGDTNEVLLVLLDLFDPFAVSFCFLFQGSITLPAGVVGLPVWQSHDIAEKLVVPLQGPNDASVVARSQRLAFQLLEHRALSQGFIVRPFLG